MTPWEIKGLELVNCTCEYGCNCQFDALPDKGHCHAVAGIQINEGHYGKTKLDGLRIAAIFKWPGAIHEGNCEAIAFVDEKADAEQREALLKIMTGQDTDPFATMFAVYASTVTKMNAPVFTMIDLAGKSCGEKSSWRIHDDRVRLICVNLLRRIPCQIRERDPGRDGAGAVRRINLEIAKQPYRQLCVEDQPAGDP